MDTPTDKDIIVVTTAAKLLSLIDSAVADAVKRAVVEVLDARSDSVGWLTVKQAEAAYGKSRATLRRWHQAGAIESRVIGGSRFYAAP